MSSETISDPILVVVEHEPAESGAMRLTGASDRVLRLANELTEGSVYALSLTAQPDTDGLGAAGVETVYVVEAEGFSTQVPAGIADAAIAASKKIEDLGAILAVSTYSGRAVAAMLGIRLGAGSAVDVSELEIEDGGFRAYKSALSGSWKVKFEITGGVPILALRAGAGSDAEVAPGPATVEPLDVELSPAAKAVKVEQSKRIEGTGRVGLNEAEVAVVGGRGVDGDFSVVEDLADALGGAVGATRVACDEGWVGRSAQIGQTGLSIAPKLYVGLGVSGAVHHTCGMLASETIVAIVDDPDAPITELADFTVIGDVSEVVPAALEALRARGADV